MLHECATNGLHSPMAEAMLKWLDSEHFEVISAGTICGQLHPLTVEVLKEIGIDLGRKTPKSLEQLPDEKFDYVITLGSHAPSSGQTFRGAEIVHWKFDDAVVPDDPEKQLGQFRMVRDQILQRLRLFVLVHARPQAAAPRTSLSMVQADDLWIRVY